MQTYKYNNPNDTDPLKVSRFHELMDLHELTGDTVEAIEADILALGYRKVLMTEAPDDGYRYGVSGFEEVNGVLQTTLVRVNEAQNLVQLEAYGARVKQRRNELLGKCDWTQMPDVPLSAEAKQAWATYRQALRDLTAQAKFPWNVVWPEQPTE
jgi:hypothetical protein